MVKNLAELSQIQCGKVRTPEQVIDGDMAQLVARFHGMEEVRGSIPLIST